MTKKLWIFEKPDVGRKVAQQLPGPHKSGDGFIETGDGIVTWAFGHLLEQCYPEDYDTNLKKWTFDTLPILPDNWKLKPTASKAKQVSVIKKLMKDCDVVVNGGDEGREGQLLIDELLIFLNWKKKSLRYLSSEVTPAAIKKAVSNLKPNENYFNLYVAALMRSRADWLIGINGTRAFTLKAQENGYNGVLSVGRVQTPTAALVVKRDLEIENFVPVEYWALSAKFADPNQPNLPFWTRWLPPGITLEMAEQQAKKDDTGETDEDDDDSDDSASQNGNSRPAWLDEGNRIIDKKTAEEIINKVKNAAKGHVSLYIKKPAEELAPLPFELTNLQSYVSSKYGITLEAVMKACQSLYEKGYTTYPRTDCEYLPEAQHPDAAQVLDALAKCTPKLEGLVDGANKSIKGRAFNDSKIGEHHAIIPTYQTPNFSSLTDDEQKTYNAIAERYIAQFYPNCKVDRTKIEVTIAEERFATSGRVVKDLGWRVIYQGDTNAGAEDTLPALKENDVVDLKDTKIENKFTSPPPYYTEPTLLKAMKNIYLTVSDPQERKKLKALDGIGRSATRTGIIGNLFSKNILAKQGKRVYSTPAARVLVQSVPKQLIEPQTTAQWEAYLDDVANGKIKGEQFEAQQKKVSAWIVDFAKQMKLQPIEGMTAPAKKSYSGGSSSGKSTPAKKSSGSAASKGKKCPKCGQGTMVQRQVKSGPKQGTKFLGCSNYPNCNHSEWPK